MTNRQRIINTSPYDLILQINQGLEPDECVLQVLHGAPKELRPCPRPDDYPCEQCIQDWLNKGER